MHQIACYRPCTGPTRSLSTSCLISSMLLWADVMCRVQVQCTPGEEQGNSAGTHSAGDGSDAGSDEQHARPSDGSHHQIHNGEAAGRRAQLSSEAWVKPTPMQQRHSFKAAAGRSCRPT